MTLLGVLPATAPSAAWSARTLAVSGLSPAYGGLEENLDSLSCPVPGSCVAVGYYQDIDHNLQGLIETITGATSKATTVPTAGLKPAAGAVPWVVLNSVACWTSGACLAVGTYADAADNEHGLIENLVGGAWKAMTMPTTGLSAPPGTSSAMSLDLLTCHAPGTCVATGGYRDTSGSDQGVLASLSRGAWKVEDAPTAGLDPPAGASPQVQLNALSCPSAGSCVAVGSYFDASSRVHGLIETLADGAWKAETAPTTGLAPPAGANPGMELDFLACPAVGSCVAVGSYDQGSDSGRGLIETLAGGVWKAATDPPAGLDPPAGANPAMQLMGLSCSAVGSCTAVGIYGIPATKPGTGHGFAEVLAAGKWSAHTLPTAGLSPAAQAVGMQLTALSCPAKGSCIVVGSYLDASGNLRGLIENLSAGVWKATTAPVAGLSPAPGKNPVAQLLTLSCSAAAACQSVGSYAESSGDTAPMSVSGG